LDHYKPGTIGRVRQGKLECEVGLRDKDRGKDKERELMKGQAGNKDRLGKPDTR